MAKAKKNKEPIVSIATQSTATRPLVNSTKDWFDTLTTKQSLWICIGLIIFVGTILYWNLLTQKYAYLFTDIGSDTFAQSYPHHILINNYFSTETSIGWSFSQGLGQNIYPFWTDLYNLLVEVILPKENIPTGYIWVEFLKNILCGLLFYYYLRIIQITGWVAIVGAIIIAFCGYMVLGGQWYFSSEVVVLVIWMIALEKSMTGNEWYWFVIAVMIAAIQQPFWLYLNAILTIFYVYVRKVESVQQYNLKSIFYVYLKLCFAGILGLMLSGFLFLSNIQQMLDSPRGSGDFALSNQLSTINPFGVLSGAYYGVSLLRFFSSDILGTGDAFTNIGAFNYFEAPMSYIGLLTLLLFPHFFVFATKKQRQLYGTLLGLSVITIVFPYFRRLFWMFTGDYFRTISLFISMLFCYMSLNALKWINEQKRINYWVLIGVWVGCVVVLYYPYDKVVPVVPAIRKIVTLLLLVYTILIIGLTKPYFSFISKLAILSIIVGELLYLSNFTVNKRPLVRMDELLHEKKMYNDYSQDAVGFINKSATEPFYRVEKDFSIGFNDSQAQGYYGTSAYNSFNQKYHIRFLKELDRAKNELDSRWAKSLTDAPLLQSLVSVKYLISTSAKNSNRFWATVGFDSLKTINGEVRVLKNRLFLPLGFSYNRYIPFTTFRQIKDPLQKQVALLMGVVLEDEALQHVKNLQLLTLPEIEQASHLSIAEIENNLISPLRENASVITKFTQNYIEADINLKTPRHLFYSIPYDKGWSITVDGKEQPFGLSNIGFMGTMIEAGKHHIVLQYEPPHRKTGMVMSLVGLVIFWGAIFWSKKNKKQ
jgi:uncharacterized membrane protein YfhO